MALDEWHVLRQTLQFMFMRMSQDTGTETKYVEICQRAYEFPRTAAFATLSKLARTGNSHYARVQHYVGRLRSWKKAAAFIIGNVKDFEHVLHRTDVRIVPAVKSNAAIRVETDLGALVTRQCPNAAQTDGLLRTTVARLQTARHQINKLSSNAQHPVSREPALMSH